MATVRDLAAFIKGKKPALVFDSPQDNSLPYVLIENFSGTYTAYTNDPGCVRCKPSDTIIVADGANTGLTSTNHDGYIGSTLGAVRPNQAKINPRYLFFFLQSHFTILNTRTRGAAIPHLEKELLLDLELCLPPLPEQKRIVRILDEAEALRNMRTQTDYATKILISALFAEMFDKPSLPSIPLEKMAVEERNSFVNGPFGSDLLSSELTDKGVPVVYIRDISTGKYERKSTVFVTPAKAAQLRFCNVLPGDVLITKVGSPPGVAAIYPTNETEGIVTQDVIRIRLDSEFAIPEYVVSFLNSVKGQNELQQIMIQATRQRFSLGNLKKISIPKPPLPLQKEFAARVSKIRSLEAVQSLSRQRLDDLFQSLLHRAFQGNL